MLKYSYRVCIFTLLTVCMLVGCRQQSTLSESNKPMDTDSITPKSSKVTQEATKEQGDDDSVIHKESEEVIDLTESHVRGDTTMKEPETIEIKISAAGDCTLGTDTILEQYSYKTFMEEYEDQEQSKSYFLKKVSKIFEEDDLTIVNLETTLTTATKKASKKYRFKGLPEFNDILVEGNIDAVSLANNHTYDYLQEGYSDTIKYLKEAGIGYFGNADYDIREIKGIKIGLVGYTGWAYNSRVKEKIRQHMDKLKQEGCKLIIVSFHWGEEYEFYPNEAQKKLGHFVIDEGADLVLGHHPHVIQGIENYENKYIVYSLGNFCFGGNLNPKDKDTFIFQQTFTFEKLEEDYESRINIIPCSVSSRTDRNDFQPMPLEGDAYLRVIKRINDYSKNLNFNYDEKD